MSPQPPNATGNSRLFGRGSLWVYFAWLIVLCGGVTVTAVTVVTAPGAIRTPRHAVVTDYHGVKVSDDYQWLENGGDPAVHRWSDAQNKQARTVLDHLETRPWVTERLKQLLDDPSPDYFALTWRRGLFFALKLQPPAQQPVLVTLRSVTNLSSERVVVDPNKLDPKGSTTIDWYVPSPDGKQVAVSLSENGSELGTLYVFDSRTGEKLPDSIPRVHGPTAGGSAAWNADGSGIFYTRYPRKGERPEADLSFFQQVYFHRFGSPATDDVYEIGNVFPRVAEIVLKSSPDGRRLLATVADGDGGEFAFYLREPTGQWRRIARFDDGIIQAEFGRDPLYIEAGKDDALYLLSRADAPKGKILRLPFDAPDLIKASVIVPEGTNVIKNFRPSASGLAMIRVCFLRLL
jgi:prolyl oligopeptidase